MQEIVYKIILEDTALIGQNCWDSVKPLNYQAGPFNWFFENSAPLLIFVDQEVIFQIPGWGVGKYYGSIFLIW
jgi:hypothetical protein